jgi:hypothetical protein
LVGAAATSSSIAPAEHDDEFYDIHEDDEQLSPGD